MSLKELIKAELELLPQEELQKLYDIIKSWNQESVETEDDLGILLADCEMKTGITDLSYQHDHYLYNLPKKEIE